jgi:integrase
MSTSSASRDPLLALPGPTLADVLAHLGTDQTCSPRQRQDRASAIRTLAKALRRRPEEIPAGPGQLQRLTKAFNPIAAGLSPRRWRNVVSLTRTALKQAGIRTVPGRHTTRLSPAWVDPYRYLNRISLCIGLSRFAHHCSDRCIDPGQVDDQVMADYLETLLEQAVIREPREVHRVTCLCWNEAVATIPTWPKRSVTVPSYVRSYSLPWETFPSSLKREVDAYIERLSGRDLLAELDFRPLKPSSLKSREYQLGQFASALVHRGRDPATIRSLADLVEIDALKEGLRFFLDRSDAKPTKQIHDIASTLKAVARHQVRVAPAHLEQIKSICSRLDVGRGGLTEKNRHRLRQFDDARNVGALLHLPTRLLAEARKHQKPTLKDALLVQTALCVELLLMTQLRIANLAGLDIDRHIIFSRRRGGPVHIAIPKEEVKNEMEIEGELPASAVHLLDVYLKIYRPLLLRVPSRWLFPGEGADHKYTNGLSVQIKTTIASKTGLQVNPHLFRHIGGKLYLDHNPGAYGVIRLVHRHKTVETTIRHYCGTETAAAMRQFDAQVLKLREHYPDAAQLGRRRATARVR